MRLPRLTTRRLMALVAVAAILLGIGRLWRLRVSYQERAVRHRHMAGFFRSFVTFPAAQRWIDVETRDADADTNRRAEYWAALERKYEYAARYPWLPVPPDPPPPK